MEVYLFDELRENKLKILQNYEIRKLIGYPKNDIFVEHFKTVFKQKSKVSEIQKIMEKTILSKNDYDILNSILGSINIFDKFTIKYLTCYITCIEEELPLNDKMEEYMSGYEDMYVEKPNKNLINRFDEIKLKTLSDTGLTKEILQELIDNKEDIIKNYYYRQVLDKRTKDGDSTISGETHLDAFIGYMKSKESISNVNDISKKAPEFLFEMILSTLHEFDEWTLEYLTVYSSIIKKYNSYDLRKFKSFSKI